MKFKTGGIKAEPRIPLFCAFFIRLSIHISSYLTIYLIIYVSIIYLTINLPDRWDMKVKAGGIKVEPWIPLFCNVSIRLSIYVSSYLTIYHHSMYLAIHLHIYLSIIYLSIYYLSIIYLSINLPDRWDMKVKTVCIKVEPRIPLFCDVSSSCKFNQSWGSLNKTEYLELEQGRKRPLDTPERREEREREREKDK